ncbi:MAG: TetR/AcrR family transcriptional regulator [Deltaproteobacteria bacterium]|nr:TetR/AcrR family transcriptional regulator [Deltaproteobacteria bacterium]
MLKDKGRAQPKQKRAEETREKIIAAATELFSKDGFHTTSSKKIAKAAGVAVGSFYNHFPDKKSLLFEIHRRHSTAVHEMIAEKVSHIFTTEDVDSRILTRELIRQALAMHSFSPDLHRELTALAYTDPDFAAMARRDEEDAVLLITKLFDPWRDALRIVDLEATAWVISQSVEAVIHGIKIFGAPVEEQRLTDALGDMIHRMLFADTETRVKERSRKRQSSKRSGNA